MVHTNRHGPWRPWLIAWLGAAALGVANGVARGALYERRIGSRPAHFLSTGALLVLLSAYMRVLSRAWPIASRGQALQIGFVWAGLTVAFEFGLDVSSPTSRGLSCSSSTTSHEAGSGC